MNLLKAFFRKHDRREDTNTLENKRSSESQSQAITPSGGWRTLLERVPSNKTLTNIDHPPSAMSSMLERLKIAPPKQRGLDRATNTTGLCRLLELPAELRNKIWDLTFTGTTVTLGASTTAPALLFTCKQINSEASGAYWRLSEFKSWKILEIRDFLARIGPTKLALIANITYDPAANGGQPSAARDTTGIAYSAFMAEWDRFWVDDWLRDTGVMLPLGFKIKIPFMAAHGELMTSSKPWQEFRRLLSEVGGSKMSGGSTAKQVGQMQVTSQTIDDLVRTVEEQSRFFDYEHLSLGKCWTTKWCVVPGYTCGCPAKMIT